MELNAAQTKFVQELRTMLSLYQGNADPRLKSPSTNLEWNTKKITGEFSDGTSLDGTTYAQRTKADLELVAAALPAGAAGQAYAVRAAGEVASVFTVPAAGSQAAPTGEAATPAFTTPVVVDDGSPAPATGTAAGSAPVTDVKALLTQKADHAGEKLAWKTSVVDLLKLLGKDSSQTARHRYAVALGFPEAEISKMPSSEFNDWLHGQLMGSLASNGGNLPSNIA